MAKYVKYLLQTRHSTNRFQWQRSQEVTCTSTKPENRNIRDDLHTVK